MEEILKQILGSQKDIQKTLQQQSQVLQQHGKILEQQGEALQQQSSQLDSLQKGQTTLESHIDLLDSNQITEQKGGKREIESPGDQTAQGN
jgi:uncharacterized protein involved in exopolysaccharide biosynthesis